jgi:phage-related protein
MAESQNKTQEEYNDLLEMTQSMLGKMNTAMSELNNSSDKRNKKLSQQISLNQEILNSVKSLKDLEAAVGLIKENNNNISKQNFGVNQKLLKTFLAQTDAVKAILKSAEDTKKVFQAVRDIADETANSFNSTIDEYMSKLERIPIVGKALKNFFQPFADKAKEIINNVSNKFVDGFTKSFSEARASGKTFMESLSNGVSGGMKSISSEIGMIRQLATSLMSTIGLIGIGILAIGVGAYIGYKRFLELDAAAKSFRESTGLLNSQTQQTQQNIQNISTSMAGLGVSAEDVAEAAGQFTHEFGGLEQPAKGTLESMVMLNKNFGVGFSEATKLNKVFQNMGGLSEAQAQSMTNSVVEMSKLAGVAPSKVIADIAQNSEVAYKYFRGGPKELAKAAVSLAAMGSSLESAAKSSESLLDFESSITSELEASAMLGKQLNFDKARTAAFNGDLYGQEKAIMEQLQGIGDISKMNYYQKEALTKATGKEIGELENLQRIQERFPDLDEKRLAAANALLDSGKDISKITDADLDAQNKRLESQKEMQSQMDNLQNSVSALGTGFMDMFEPFAAFLMPIITDLVDILGSILMPMMKGLGSVFKIVFGALSAVWNILMAIIKPIVAISAALFENMITPISMVSDALQPIFAKFGELKNKIMEAIAPLLIVLTSIGKILGTVLVGAVNILGKAFDFVFGGLFSVIESIGKFIQTYLVEPIMNAIGSIKSGFDTVANYIPGFGGDKKEGVASDTSAMQKEAVDGALGMDSSGYQVVDDSINDGIVQNGKVISTNPKDTIVAMQKPNELAKIGNNTQPSQLASGLGDDTFLGNLMNGFANAASTVGNALTPDALKFDELIAEIKGLRADLTGGKVGVNMDGKKVTAGVSKVVTQTTGNAYALR